MRMFRTRTRAALSLRSRIRLLTVSVAALAVAICSVAIYMVTESALRAQLTDRVGRDADRLIASDSSGLSPAVFGFAAGPGASRYLRVGLVGVNGDIYTATGTFEPFVTASGALEPEVAAVVDGQRSRVVTDLNGYAVAIEKGPSGSTVLVAESYDSLAGVLGGLLVIFVTVGGSLVVLAGMSGYLVAVTGLRPVGRLTRATRRITDTGDLSPVEVAGDDELAHLAGRFNDMLRALQRSRQAQNHLIVDAGRELLAPLTALRTNIELLIDIEDPHRDGVTLDPAAEEQLRRDIVDQLDEVARRIHRLVDDAREAHSRGL
ncbi:MAG: HAMP domain-containing protein [Rhodococcus sp. (in: high G+C Gram-positive bacteria)]